MDLTSTTFCVIMLGAFWRGRGGQGCILKHYTVLSLLGWWQVVKRSLGICLT